jgi:hypothetical protein
MKLARTLLTAVATFLAFAPVTFVWHTVLFPGFYLGPQFMVKSADAFDPKWILGANVLLAVGLAVVLPALLPARRRLSTGAAIGALFASLLIDYHNLSLMGLFPGGDPASLYLMDALWAVVDGALAGIVATLTWDRLGQRAPAVRTA